MAILTRRSSRRTFLKVAGSAAAVIGCGQAASESPEAAARPEAAAPRDPPNILIIMTDQHRADLMTCAGRDLVPTPAIDRIAARGVRFESACCPYPVCVGSRMALLTGLYPHSTGAIANKDRLDWRYRTIAHHCAEQGYLTALIGKMHFNDAHKHGFEYHLSIDDWLMYLGPKAQHYANEIASNPLAPHFFASVADGGAGFPDVEDLWDGPSPWAGKVTRSTFDSMASALEPEDHLDAFIAREAAKFLRRHKDQRFFLLASFMKPHTPFFPPREWAARYPVASMALPPPGDPRTYPPHIRQRIEHFSRIDEKCRRAARAGYLGNLAFVDTCIGTVYGALEAEGLADRTIVVYTSDHGEMDGDHGLFGKFCFFEPSVRVPLIVSYPRAVPQNKVARAPVEGFGLYPTLCDLAGIPPPRSTTIVPLPGSPERIDARSFAAIARAPDLEGPGEACCEHALRTRVSQYMIRTRRHKYNFNHGSTHELYDLEADPGETKNVIDVPAYAKVRDELRERLVARYDPEKNPYRPAR